ncbi:cytochrome b5-like heme/steroid binding domain-containing protein [Xylariaceae sp. FL0804]|nr:cytochrome b5-like heme/steroid binding domain-containing protein [Xylariaceae sp. FL0804]
MSTPPPVITAVQPAEAVARGAPPASAAAADSEQAAARTTDTPSVSVFSDAVILAHDARPIADSSGETVEPALLSSALVRPEAPKKTFALKQVAEHNLPTDLWILIDQDIYDVTEFQLTHPGGAKILAGVAGRDATKKFDKYHRRGILDQYRPTLQVGLLDYGEAMSNSKKGFLKKLGIGGSSRQKGGLKS